MKIRRVLFAISLAIALPLTAAESAPGPTAADAIAQLKRLAGKWSGKTNHGEPMTIRYEVAAHGSTVVETQSPGEPDEMLTVYSIEGNDLVLTHYCPMGPVGNQPHMVLDRHASSPRELHFTFVSLSNLDAAKDVHLHGGTVKIVDDRHIERTWDVYNNGRKVATQTFVLARED